MGTNPIGWTAPRTWEPGAKVTALQLNQHLRDNLSALKNRVDVTGLHHNFRGLLARINPRAPTVYQLLKAEEVVMQDGVSYQNVPALSADIMQAGAGGLDTGAPTGLQWYEVYLIGKSSTQSNADLQLIFHRMKEWRKDFENTSVGTTRAFRGGPVAGQEAVAQSLKAAEAGAPLPFVDVLLNKSGAPGGDFWVEIRPDDGTGKPHSSTVLATSERFPAGSLHTTLSWHRIPFLNPFTPADTATTYWLVFQATAGDTTNFVSIGIVSPGPYANGETFAMNNGVWTSIASGSYDITFKLYSEIDHGPLVLPAGYDEYARIGFVRFSGSSQFIVFTQINNRVIHLGGAVIGTATTTQPMLVDLQQFVPPRPVTVLASGKSTVAAQRLVLGSGIDGWNTNYSGHYSCMDAPAASSSGWNVIHTPVVTDWQTIYTYLAGTPSGTSTFVYNGYEF